MALKSKVSTSRTSRCSGQAEDTAAPAANTAAVATLAAVANCVNVASGISWSYSGTPTNGLLTLSDGGATIRQWYITAGGPGQITFPTPISNAAINTSLVATLAAGGGTVSGTVNFDGAWAE